MRLRGLELSSLWGLGLGAAQETHSTSNMRESDPQSKVAVVILNSHMVSSLHQVLLGILACAGCLHDLRLFRRKAPLGTTLALQWDQVPSALCYILSN